MVLTISKVYKIIGSVFALFSAHAAAQPCQSCNRTSFPCEEARPTEMTFLFTGGGCADSINVQDEHDFWCRDFGTDPGVFQTDIRNATTPFLVVTAERDETIVYFEDYVRVGQLFRAADESNSNFQAFHSYAFYGSENTTADNLLLTMGVAVHCSRGMLYLNDKYGPLQVAGWVNKAQERVGASVGTSANATAFSNWTDPVVEVSRSSFAFSTNVTESSCPPCFSP